MTAQPPSATVADVFAMLADMLADASPQFTVELRAVPDGQLAVLDVLAVHLFEAIVTERTRRAQQVKP
jgi:hypothetical protein